MFAYYAKWTPKFSDKIQLLINNTTFSLTTQPIEAFTQLKKQLSTYENLPFVVECDASDVNISGVLNQGKRPLAFMSKAFTR